MRFAFVSVALLALAYSLPPGVHGAPAVVADHTNLLAIRQDTASIVGAVLDLVTGVVQKLLGTVAIPSQIAEQLEQQIAQALQNGAASGVAPRAPSDSISSAYPTFLTTTSDVLPVATDRIGTSTVSSVSSSTPPASSTTQARMRRQIPSVLPFSVLSDVISIVGSLSTSLPVPSPPLAVPTGTPGSVTPPPATSEPTPSNPSSSTSSQV